MHIVLRYGIIKYKGGEKNMTVVEATSNVFLTAFRALPKKQKEAVVEKLLNDKEFREDLVDIVLIEQRKKEPSRSLAEYLLEKRKR